MIRGGFPVPIYALAPELAALDASASTLDILAELLDDLHPELLSGKIGTVAPECTELQAAIAACVEAMSVYKMTRLEAVPGRLPEPVLPVKIPAATVLVSSE